MAQCFLLSVGARRLVFGGLAMAIVACSASVRPVAAQAVTTKGGDATTRSTTAADPRAADKAAVAAMHDSFVKAFETRDAAALAAHWTAEGEYENEAGVIVQGRDALTKGFAAFFAKTPEVKAEMKPSGLRFLGRDTASGTGTVTVRRGPAEPSTRARYEALIVREEGKWRLAKLTESEADEPTLEDLAWLIGEWKSSRGEGAEIRTTYSWAPNKKFIHVDFTLKEPGLTLSGKQVLGVDPATGIIRSWTFEADGGVGTGDWSRDGDHWTIEASGTLASGGSIAETNVLRRVNDDTLTWQSVNRSVDGAAFPDLPPVKVTRVKASR